MQDVAARAAELGIQPEHTDGRGVPYRVEESVLNALSAALEAGSGAIAHHPAGILIWRCGRTLELSLDDV